MKKISDVHVVATSSLVSILDVGLNLILALITGSAVMISQALQGLSDLTTAGILYFGVKQSKRGADEQYQFGHGREVFFWVLIATFIMFIGTGGLSIYFGYQQIANPQPVQHIFWAIFMLIFGFATNFYAFRLSLIRLKQNGDKKSWWRQLLSSSIVETKATLLIDFLGTFGAVLGLVALLTYLMTNNAKFDGLGSIAIGLSMMFGAFMLTRDVRDLIVGKAVDDSVAKKIIRVAKKVEGVNDVLDLRTMYLGSEKLLVILEVHIKDELDTDEIEEIVDAVKDTVHKAIPEVHHIQVEVETPDEA